MPSMIFLSFHYLLMGATALSQEIAVNVVAAL
jgi:hypothetical protein